MSYYSQVFEFGHRENSPEELKGIAERDRLHNIAEDNKVLERHQEGARAFYYPRLGYVACPFLRSLLTPLDLQCR
jgi:hypothetical protein